MGFHKHGVFSFTVDVQRIGLIAGDNFVADVTALRRHRPNGSADRLQVPAMSEEYGETAPQAEARVIRAMREWLMRHSDKMMVPDTYACHRDTEAQRHRGNFCKYQCC